MEVLHPYQYKKSYSQDIQVKAKSGELYELEAPWTSNHLGSIYGKGRVLANGEWLPFEGEIPFTAIVRVDKTVDTVWVPIVVGAVAMIAVLVGFGLSGVSLGGSL